MAGTVEVEFNSVSLVGGDIVRIEGKARFAHIDSDFFGEGEREDDGEREKSGEKHS